MERHVEPSARPVGLVKWYETVWQRQIHRKPLSSGQPCKRGFGKTSGLAWTSFSSSQLLPARYLRGQAVYLFEYCVTKGSMGCGAPVAYYFPFSGPKGGLLVTSGWMWLVIDVLSLLLPGHSQLPPAVPILDAWLVLDSTVWGLRRAASSLMVLPNSVHSPHPDPPRNRPVFLRWSISSKVFQSEARPSSYWLSHRSHSV